MYGEKIMQNEENKLISYACEQFKRGGGYD